MAASTFLHNSVVLKVSLHACDSVSALLRHLTLATIRELSVFPKRRSRHFYFSTVDESKLLPSGESDVSWVLRLLREKEKTTQKEIMIQDCFLFIGRGVESRASTCFSIPERQTWGVCDEGWASWGR